MGGFRDGGLPIFDIWEVSLDGTPTFYTYMNFHGHHFCCFTIAPLFDLDKSTA
jgi:hypothetical protein